ncbi:F0F1 ATP synthase subunit B [Paracoccus sp. SJTW-4]|uniref:F0F1 ATP synthase subunit B n=1 Tax=Paracoccus sp. SJTW-4 TaxID=3078428 RepID=UPI0039E98AB9
MIARLIAVAAALAASPALAASGPFFSLRNTDFIVTLAFLGFIGILLYFRIPAAIGKLLDKRAEAIKADIAEARRLRDEAQDIYASYERRQREVRSQADEIVANARREAMAQAEKAKLDLQKSIERRLAAAQDQIAAAEGDAVRAVRDRAVQVAMSAATELLGAQMDAGARSAGIDRAIDDVARHLN